MRQFWRGVRPVMMVLAIMLAGGGADARGKALSFEDFIALGRVSDPQISPDGRHVAFVVSTPDIEENTSETDIYLVPIQGGDTRRLTQDPASDSHPRFSPNGRWIAFHSSRGGKTQIWVLPTGGGEARQVTHLSTGASGPEWTPDGRYILFTSRVYPDCPDDDCNEKRDDAKEKSKVQARIFTDLFYRHWDEWRDDKRSHVFRVSLDGEDVKDLTPGDVDYPTVALGSGHDIAVSPDGREICVAVNGHDHPERNIDNDLVTLDVAGGDRKTITDNPANDNQPVYSPDGRYIAYRAMSRLGFEADRYRLVLYDRSSGKTVDVGRQLAEKFDRSVRTILWSPDSRRIYVTCSDAGYVSLYAVDARSGKTRQLTKKMYVSSPRVSPDSRRLVFLAQSGRSPNEVMTAGRNGGHVRALSHVNDEALSSLDMNPLEEFSFAGAGGTTVHGFLLKPPGFDPSRKYPLLFLIHGGPQGAWSASFHPRWNYQMFAAPGYVVVAVNPRGSTGYGQKFTDEISRDWGGKVYEDLMKGLDHVLDTYGFIDRERIAAAGGSFGGYMINWIEGHTDRFDCLINHDGLYSLESFYGTTEELWFPEWDLGGTPWDDPENYRRYSPNSYAKNFKTPMLVIHGGRDYRVDQSEAFQVFTALRRQDVPAKLLYFPDEGHWVLKHQNARLWWRTLHEWLAEWLGK